MLAIILCILAATQANAGGSCYMKLYSCESDAFGLGPPVMVEGYALDARTKRNCASQSFAGKWNDLSYLCHGINLYGTKAGASGFATNQNKPCIFKIKKCLKYEFLGTSPQSIEVESREINCCYLRMD